MPMTIPEQVIQSLIVWIDENIHRQLHIDDIAKHAGYSKWHLQRIFVHYRGETLARKNSCKGLLRLKAIFQTNIQDTLI